MRIKEKDFDTEIGNALSEKLVPTVGFEEKLFAAADVLLEKRRDFTSARSQRREAFKRSAAAFSAKTITRKASAALGQLAEVFSARPFIQGGVALAVLVIAILTRAPSQGPALTWADLPEFPKFNNAAASYDAMWQAERNSYDKEVEDARREPSGDI